MIGRLVVVVPVTVPEQLSVAVGAVRLVTLHSAVTSDNEGSFTTGAVVSSITTFCVCVLVLPSPSVYVHVTTVVP